MFTASLASVSRLLFPNLQLYGAAAGELYFCSTVGGSSQPRVGFNTNYRDSYEFKSRHSAALSGFSQNEVDLWCLSSTLTSCSFCSTPGCDRPFLADLERRCVSSW